MILILTLNIKYFCRSYIIKTSKMLSVQPCESNAQSTWKLLDSSFAIPETLVDLVDIRPTDARIRPSEGRG